MAQSKKQTAAGKPKKHHVVSKKKHTVKSNGNWIEIADGVKMRTRSLDEARAENPVINYIWLVDGQTDLNGTRLSLEQLAIVRKFFGENCTLQNIQLWLEKKNLKIERLNWLHILELIEEASGGNAGDKKKLKKKQPLSEKASAVLELLKTLPEHRGMTGPKILETLDAKSIHIDQSTLTKNIIPELQSYGVKNKPRIGYYIEG